MALEPAEELSANVPPAQKGSRGLLGGLGFLGLLLFKFWGVVLLALAKLKFLLVIFKFKTLLSMLLMIWFETLRFGPAFGVGFVLLMLVHEMGHYGMAKKLGLDVSSPVFIPFLGALIAMKEAPENVEVEAKVAIAGPIIGSLGALACLGIYLISGERLFLSLTYMGLFLNLFNLLPVRPLDGGRVVGALSPLFWLIGLGMLLAMVFIVPSPILWIILILGALEFWRWHKSDDKRYFEVPLPRRLAYAAGYFGLCAALAGGIAVIYPMLHGA
ncbi:MAG: site-2 protease family protein [Candidatus Sericytochromatia bacterium]